MVPQTRSRVLCVDDDVDVGEMLAVLLNAYGVDATCVQTAADAWLEINKETFCLYVLDGWLPHVDGFEFCRQIREADFDTPILFYSGAAYEADREKGIAAGATAYVAKPDVDCLMETVVRLLAVPMDNALGRATAGCLLRGQPST